MKEILDLVNQRKEEFAKAPFFEFMQDKNIDPRKKFVWVPYAAPFLMGFKDVFSYAIFEKHLTEPIHEHINRYATEESRHVLWYLQDLQKLGFNSSLKYADVLGFLWSSEIERIRHLSYDLITCANQKDIVLKLAVIDAVEATAYVGFSTFAEVTNELQKLTKHNYNYFGKAHSRAETEQKHIHGFDEAESYLRGLKITQEQRIAAIELVECVFDIFNEFLDICLKLAKKYEQSQPLFKSSETELLARA
ncbi:hypothetical protein [Calothrix sp. PCC 6303]|uniref:hypothetical protein n=1 Tax=Calothrix sp. PCC 6303 TaxID=1170562 RepID=UPI0002A04C0C|nr:hypothetical protein [Calothrix sp. PCC 6303]AFZ04057.1 hypothetical protein Cal6303_5169 [Calothrix sp. PCC 6303]